MGWEGRKRRGGWEGGGRGREGRGCGGARKVVYPGARAGSRRACIYLRQRSFDASKPRVAASTDPQYQYVHGIFPTIGGGSYIGAGWTAARPLFCPCGPPICLTRPLLNTFAPFNTSRFLPQIVNLCTYVNFSSCYPTSVHSNFSKIPQLNTTESFSCDN